MKSSSDALGTGTTMISLGQVAVREGWVQLLERVRENGMREGGCHQLTH